MVLAVLATWILLITACTTNCQEMTDDEFMLKKLEDKGITNNISQILDNLIKNYDKRLRPNYGGEPVEVLVTIYVVSISAVSEVDMDYTIDMYLRQYWNDPRLTFDPNVVRELTVGVEMVNHIWVPDTFFPNEKRSYFHEATTHNSFLRISHSGKITRSLRLTVTAMCPMDLVNFPLDKQNCSLEIESYGYSVADISYYWLFDKLGITNATSVAVQQDTNLPQFSFTGVQHDSRNISLSTGNYSRLSTFFLFHRKFGFYLIQVYLPSSLIVIISWVSFWLNREATQARVAIGVTTVLTMTTLMTSTNSSMPKVSYVKSIDLYLGACFIIVFASLLEYAMIGYMMKRLRMRRDKRLDSNRHMPRRSTVMQNDNTGGLAHRQSVTFEHASRSRDRDNSTANMSGPESYYTSTMPKSRGTKRPSLVNTTETAPLQQDNPWYSPRGSLTPHQFHIAPQRNDTGRAFYVGNRGSVKLKYRKQTFKPSSIDKYSRIFFPLTFVSFHIIYWTIYLEAVDML